MISKEILERLLEEKEVTAYQVSKETGVSESTLSRILNNSEIKPSNRTLMKLSSFFGVDSKTWEPITQDVSKLPTLIADEETLDAIPEQFRQWVKPYYPDMKVGAGMELGFYRQPTKYFILVPYSENVTFWAQVEGNSMYPKYNNRDLVGLSEIHYDGVFGGNNYVVELLSGSAHLKRVDFIRGNKDAINLHSYNPDFEDKEMELSKIHKFFKVNMHIGFE